MPDAQQTAWSCREEGVALCRWGRSPETQPTTACWLHGCPAPEAVGTLADVASGRAPPLPVRVVVGPGCSGDGWAIALWPEALKSGKWGNLRCSGVRGVSPTSDQGDIFTLSGLKARSMNGQGPRHAWKAGKVNGCDPACKGLEE